MSTYSETSKRSEMETSIGTLTKMLPSTEKSIRPWIWIFGIAGVVSAVLGGVVWYRAHQAFFPKGDPLGDSGAIWGNFGSYLQGTTASLWSLAAFFMIFVAFLGQRLQIYKQSEQIDEEKKRFTIQQNSIKRQNFESSFFQLLHLHNQIVIELRGTDGDGVRPAAGRDCFKLWYESFKSDLKSFTARPNGRNEEDEGAATKRYLSFYTPKQGVLGHYFRNLYHIFKFVDASEDIQDENKQQYASLVRAQLSAYELALLFYDGITPIPPESTNKFRPLIEKFSLFKNLDRELLVWPSHQKFYRHTADGKL